MVNGTIHGCRAFDLLEITRLKLFKISEQVNLPDPFKLVRVDPHIGSSGSHAIFYLPSNRKSRGIFVVKTSRLCKNDIQFLWQFGLQAVSHLSVIFLPMLDTSVVVNIVVNYLMKDSVCLFFIIF